MVDFKIPNLCGASPELNDVLSKLADAKADAMAKLNEAASTVAAAFGAAQDELAGLKNKLQSIEIPTLPQLNLQAEIASLASLIPGTPAFLSALAKIKTEFEDDIKAAGLELDSLVSDATKAILGGGDICALVPNLVKDSGSTEPAKREPIAPNQAVAPAVTEAASVSNDNVTVTAAVAIIAKKIELFAVTIEAPTEDSGAFTLALPSAFIKISLGGGAPTSVAFPPLSMGERKNYAPAKQGEGFVYKKATITETFSVAGVVQEAAYTEVVSDNDGNENEEVIDAKTYVILKHKPVRIKSLLFHTGTGVSKGYWDKSQRSIFGLDPNIESTDENKGFYYRNQYGRHADVLIATGDYSTVGIGNKTNWATFGNQFNFYPPVKLSDHPGNISSGGTVFTSDPDIFVVSGVLPYAGTILSGSSRSNTRRLSDEKLNSKYKGMCISLTYSYLERYDPDFATT